jgi:hypothetical protein
MANGFGYMKPPTLLNGDSRSRESKVQLVCQINGCAAPVTLPEKTIRDELLTKLDSTLQQLKTTYEASTQAGEDAAMYWADIATNSKHPLAPLAHIPGVFATLWTPEIAPTTAITLGTAGYGFVGLPKNMIHFTTPAGAAGIRASGVINSSPSFSLCGIFGPGVYMAKAGRPLNGFVPEHSLIPIFLATPTGTVRIIPRLVYVRWGLKPMPIR